MTVKEIVTTKVLECVAKVDDYKLFADKYTLDVYIDKKPKYKCRIIDVNSWPQENDDVEEGINSTSGLLFKHEDLRKLTAEGVNEDLEFRVIDEDSGVIVQAQN